jgi:hypothetical protein
MICLASLTVFIGSKWAARRKEHKGDDDTDGEEHAHDESYERETVDLQWWQVALMPVMSSLSLLVLFFFFKYVQWVLIIWISFTAWAASFEVSRQAIVDHGPSLCQGRNATFTAVTFACVTLTVWAINGSFIAHDILGCAICICCISTIRFPSMKLATLCLTLLLLYDVFWVFYSEYFFKKNVMVNVATKTAPNPLQAMGASYNIKPLAALRPTLELPIKLMWPSVLSGATNVRYIMLGLGDIVLPGFFVALARRCDVNNPSPSAIPLLPVSAPASWSIYTGGLLTPSNKHPQTDSKNTRPGRPDLFTFAMGGYVGGLVAAFTVGYVFQHAQPALIYLVPGVLLPVAARAWQTNRLLEVWNGPVKSREY